MTTKRDIVERLDDMFKNTAACKCGSGMGGCDNHHFCWNPDEDTITISDAKHTIETLRTKVAAWELQSRQWREAKANSPMVQTLIAEAPAEATAPLKTRLAAAEKVAASLRPVARWCELIDNRAAASDGPVARTEDAASVAEMRELVRMLAPVYAALTAYNAAKGGGK